MARSRWLFPLLLSSLVANAAPPRVLLGAPARGPHGPLFRMQPMPMPPPPPACEKLPPVRRAAAFRPGEELDFALDAMGAEAGTLRMVVSAPQDGALPIHVDAASNTFFSKIRKVRGVATSYLDPRSFRSERYVEDSNEGDIHRTADVTFRGKPRQVDVRYSINGAPGERTFRNAQDAMDAAGAMYLLRQLTLSPGAAICFDAYGIRRLWRVTGKVEGKEHVSLPLGEFDAWHVVGRATRLDMPKDSREIHLWISDDARRLPLAAVGSIDLGAVRATLVRYARPGEAPKAAETARDLSW